MRKFSIIFLCVVIYLLIINVQVYADEWVDLGTKENVSIDKEWTITFSQAMERGTLHNNTVYVIDEKGNKKFLPTYLNADRTKLTVGAPADYYDPGSKYTLYVESKVKSKTGYTMASGYKLSFTVDPKAIKPNSFPNDELAIYFGTVTANNNLNVRSKPTTSSEVLGQVGRGDVIPVYNIDGHWAETVIDGKKGYVHKDYLKLKNPNGKVLQGIKIVVDAGHGGSDPGAIVHNPSLTYEKNIVLPVTFAVKERLELLGADVILTRNSDVFISLDERVDFSIRHYNDLFVSIHANALPNDTSVNGAETFYSAGKTDNVAEGKMMATTIQQQMKNMAQMNDRGAKASDFRVIKNNPAPSVLVELGFMTNLNDFYKLTDPEYQQLYADAIVQGIVEYYLK